MNLFRAQIDLMMKETREKQMIIGEVVDEILDNTIHTSQQVNIFIYNRGCVCVCMKCLKSVLIFNKKSCLNMKCISRCMVSKTIRLGMRVCPAATT